MTTTYPFKWRPIDNDLKEDLKLDFKEDSFVFHGGVISEPGNVWMDQRITGSLISNCAMFFAPDTFKK